MMANSNKNKAIGGCGKHPGQSMINCPLCASEQYRTNPLFRKTIENTIFYGQRLKVLRTLKGMSSQQLADETGLSKQSINKFENGKLKPAKITIIGLATYFEVSSYFFTLPTVNIEFNGNKCKIKDGQ